MVYQGNLLSKTLVIGIIFLFAVMSIIPSVAVDTVNIGHANGKSSSDDTYWWPMFRHDLQHSGFSTSTAPDTNNVRWEYYLGDGVYSSPAVVDGKVYIGSYDFNVYCLDANTGANIWNYTTGNWVRSSPAVADGKVYVGSWDNNVYCLDAITGSLIWSYQTGGDVDSSPAVADGRVYIGSYWYNDYVYCLDASTGKFIWSYTTGDDVYSSPTVADGRVYIGSDDNKVYCLDAITGSLIWSYQTGSYVESSPAVADGKLYIGSDDHKVYCLDAITGSIIWSYKTKGDVDSSPAVVDGKVYIGSEDHKVYCLDANTGDYIWSYKTGYRVWSSPAVADGKVYIGSYDGIVYAFGELDPDAPSAPDINGPPSGQVGLEYEFSFKSTSPVGNDVYYWIEWADGSNSGWLGPFDSGVEITKSHAWDAKGVYTIQAKAKDTNGLGSSWGVFGLTIPRPKATVNSLFLWLLDRFPLLEVFLRAMNLLR